MFLRFNPQIGQVFELQDAVFMTCLVHTDEEIEKVVLGQLMKTKKVLKNPKMIQHGRVEANKYLAVAKSGEKYLTYDQEEQQFELRRTLK